MSNDASVELIIADAVTTLSRRLQDESKRKRAPRGFDDAATRAAAAGSNITDNSARYHAETEHTGRIFLSAGLQAFLAYQLASSGYGCHHKGQNKEREAVKIIKTLPLVHQKSIADQVAKVDVHPNVLLLINRLSESPSKRRKLTDIDTNTLEKSRLQPYAGQNESLVPGLRPLKDNTMLLSEVNGGQVDNGLHNTSGLDSTGILTETSNLVASDATQEVTSPPAKNLPKAYPNHLCRAIRKIGDKAAIVMAFPYIRNTHFAMVLFGIHIECEDHSRYMVVNGVRVQANEWSIQGVKWEVVTEFFGSDCSEGVEHCPERKKEVEEGEERTACVTMRITSRANEDALLSLSIAIESGYKVKEVLFGE